MTFGIAGFLPGDERRIGMAKAIGYEFIESSLSALNDDFSEESISSMEQYLKEIKMPCVSVNGMFPGRIKLLGEDADKNEISEYLFSAFEKTKKLDYNVCVLGSGRSRTLPPDFSADKATDEFCRLLTETILPIAKKYGKKIAIEPLSYYITNFINTFEDAMQIVTAVNDPFLCALMDFFHLSYNKEICENYKKYGSFIGHVHISSFSNKFAFPRPFDGDDYRSFIEFLRRSGYKEKNISVEARDVRFSNDAEFKNTLSSSLEYMRKA